MLQIECCERRIGLGSLLNRPICEDCGSEWRKARLASVPYYRGALRGNLPKFAGSCVVLRRSQSFDYGSSSRSSASSKTYGSSLDPLLLVLTEFISTSVSLSSARVSFASVNEFFLGTYLCFDSSALVSVKAN